MRAAISVALVLCLLTQVQAADVEHPLKKAKVGDWVEYKHAPDGDINTRMTVTKKGDKEVTYEVRGSFMSGGREVVLSIGTNISVDITKKFEPLWANNLIVNGDIEKLDEGQVIITVSGKEYDTKWT
jgi:hypothetical protein